MNRIYSSKCVGPGPGECLSHFKITIMFSLLLPDKNMTGIRAHSCSFQGILRLRGRPTVAYDQQGLVFAVSMEGGAIKLFDSRSYDKVVCSKCCLP